MNPWNPLFQPAPRWITLPGDPPELRRWLHARATEEAALAEVSLGGAEPKETE